MKNKQTNKQTNKQANQCVSRTGSDLNISEYPQCTSTPMSPLNLKDFYCYKIIKIYLNGTWGDSPLWLRAGTALAMGLLKLGVLLLWLNTMTKDRLGKKGFTWLTLPHCSVSLKEIRTGSQAGQEPRGRSWYRGHRGERVLYWLIEPRTSPVLVPLTTPITKWENALQLKCMKAFSQLRFSPFR